MFQTTNQFRVANISSQDRPKMPQTCSDALDSRDFVALDRAQIFCGSSTSATTCYDIVWEARRADWYSCCRNLFISLAD